MSSRLASLVIGGPLLLMVIADCGRSGRELTLEEYFEQLDGIVESGDIELGRLQTDFLENPEGAEAGIVPAVQDSSSNVAEHFRRVVTDLESIDPPPFLREAHNEYVAAEVEAMDFLADISDRAWRISSLDEFTEVISDLRGPARREIEGREDKWCFTLEQLAVRKRIDVNLECCE